MLSKLRSLLAYEPAVAAWAAAGGAALIAAYLFHVTKTEGAAVTTICIALAAAYTAYQAKPRAVSVIVGALTTGVTAAGAFGFHTSAHVVAVGASVASAVLALVFRANLSPKASAPALAAVPPAAPQHAAPKT